MIEYLIIFYTIKTSFLQQLNVFCVIGIFITFLMSFFRSGNNVLLIRFFFDKVSIAAILHHTNERIDVKFSYSVEVFLECI